MIRLMDMGRIHILTEPNMKDTGKKISKMDLVKKPGQMVHATKEIINKAENLVMENSNGLMDLNTKVNF